MPRLTLEEREEKPPVWDMSQERVFLEQLLNQRFQFFLVIFSMVIAGSLQKIAPEYTKLLLTIGTAICWMFAFVLFHSQRKVDIILEQNIFLDYDHPAKVVDVQCRKVRTGESRLANAYFKYVHYYLVHQGSRRRFIGYVIPSFCCASLTAITTLAFLGKITVGAK